MPSYKLVPVTPENIHEGPVLFPFTCASGFTTGRLQFVKTLPLGRAANFWRVIYSVGDMLDLKQCPGLMMIEEEPDASR